MTLRTARRPGRRNGHAVAVEPTKPREMPRGVPDPRPAREPMPKPPYAKGSPHAREAARRGGLARAGATALADSLGMLGADASGYRRRADAFRKAQVAYLERHVGGGQLAPDVRLLVKLAALQAAGAELSFDRGDIEQGSIRANDARATLATAREYAAREAQARPPAPSSATSAIEAEAERMLAEQRSEAQP